MLRTSILGSPSQTAGYMSAAWANKVPLSFFRDASLGTARLFCQCTVQFLRTGFWRGDILTGNSTSAGEQGVVERFWRGDILTGNPTFLGDSASSLLLSSSNAGLL